jgi:hypothetical protein
MKSLFVFGLCFFCGLSFGFCPLDADYQQSIFPLHYSGSYGFEIIADHNGVIIVSSVDTTGQAYKLGVRPGMELLGWNTQPVRRKLESMKVRKYRKVFPLMSDQNIKLKLLTRGRSGESAEVFFMTPTGNNWGIRLKVPVSSP